MSLEIHHLTYHANGKPLIENISLNLMPGILYGILGANGSGKSTLLKTISRIWTPLRGELFWQKKNLMKCSRQEMSRTISLVPQNLELLFEFDVFQMAAMGRYPTTGSTRKEEHVVEEALRLADAWHLRQRLLSQLSGGERQRVYIARALATQAPILALDEPTAHLDLRHQLEIWKLLRTLASSGKLVIAAVHDLFAARRYCDSLVILEQGKCLAQGPYTDIMTVKMLQNVFGVSFNSDAGFFDSAI